MIVEEKYCSEKKKASNNEVDFEADTACLYCDRLYSPSRSKDHGFVVQNAGLSVIVYVQA